VVVIPKPLKLNRLLDAVARALSEDPPA